MKAKTHLITLMLASLPLFLPAQDNQSRFEGKWQLIASPMGVEGEGGIMTSGWEYIDFNATLSADGKTLTCHAEQFFTRNGHTYPMDWQIAIEHDGDKTRLGWICNDQQPASPVEFQEPANAYAMGGTDAADGEHRYLYLLSYNLETGREEGMTLWSGWTDSEQTTYIFPQNQQIDGIVSTTIPFSTFVGYADSWASPRVVKMSDDAAIRNIGLSQHADSPCFDLQGRRLNGQPQQGLYIRNGKKYMLK